MLDYEDFLTNVQLQVPVGYSVVKNALWIGYNYSESIPDQGWKIHLSFDREEIHSLFVNVISILFQKNLLSKLHEHRLFLVT